MRITGALCFMALNWPLRRVQNLRLGILIILLHLTVLVGCFPKATGPLFQRSIEVAPEQSIVYLYYPWFGWNVFPREVFVDGVSLTTLHGTEYYPYVTAPGRKSFTMQHDELKRRIDLKLEPNRAYFLKVDYVPLAWMLTPSGTLTLEEVPEAVALEEISKCRLMSDVDGTTGDNHGMIRK